jgi:hypothetical protein
MISFVRGTTFDVFFHCQYPGGQPWQSAPYPLTGLTVVATATQLGPSATLVITKSSANAGQINITDETEGDGTIFFVPADTTPIPLPQNPPQVLAVFQLVVQGLDGSGGVIPLYSDLLQITAF